MYTTKGKVNKSSLEQKTERDEHMRPVPLSKLTITVKSQKSRFLTSCQPERLIGEPSNVLPEEREMEGLRFSSEPLGDADREEGRGEVSRS